MTKDDRAIQRLTKWVKENPITAAAWGADVTMDYLERVKADRDALAAQVVGLRALAENVVMYRGMFETPEIYALVTQAHRQLSTDPGPRVLALNELVRALEECALPPYKDSDLASLLTTLNARASSALAKWKAGA